MTKGSKQKKRALQQLTLQLKTDPKPIVAPLKIKFNFSKDIIDCFIHKKQFVTIPQMFDSEQERLWFGDQEEQNDQSQTSEEAQLIQKKRSKSSRTTSSKDQRQTALEDSQNDQSWRQSGDEDLLILLAQMSIDEWLSSQFWRIRQNGQLYDTRASTKCQNYQITYWYSTDYNRYYQLSPYYSYSPYDFKFITQYHIIPHHIIYDTRTTLKIYNIPERFTKSDLAELINSRIHESIYDYLYLAHSKKHLRCAYINFVNTVCLHQFFIKFHNQCWSNYSSVCCYLLYSNIQGCQSLTSNFGVDKDRRTPFSEISQRRRRD